MQNVSVSNVDLFETLYHGNLVAVPFYKVAIGWHEGDARLHFWLRVYASNLAPMTQRDCVTIAEADKIYKNPLRDLKTSDPDFYWTRELDASKLVNKQRIAEAYERVSRALIPAAIAAHKAERVRIAAEQAEAEARHAERVAVLARYAPLRVSSGDAWARDIVAHDGTIIADCDNPELARLIVHCVNCYAEQCK
jgi:hypothetical protein